MSNNKSIRIKYDQNAPVDHLKLKIEQDFDFLEVLSLKITQEDVYKLYTSDYGVIVGRVLANDGFGVPNAKVSIFIKNDKKDNTEDKNIIYPYSSVSDKNSDNIRYNLLPSNKVNKCHQNVGTFPSKRNLLDNDNLVEVYDNFYKYTTVTNESGDYMLFGVPVGQQQIHIDIDLSDIGVLSQTPRDMEYKGYNIKQFDSPNKFKKSTNLDGLSQIITENASVFVYPFWGDENESEIALSKKNINLQYKFEPTCVFMGSIFTDSIKSGISKTCKPSKTSGKMSEMMVSQGSIEMIRETIDGKIENFEISGNRLINNDGVWCYQIPMNLDYVITDEYGNIKPTDDPTKGIPTRANVRFRITLDDHGDSYVQSKTGVYLIPNFPKEIDDDDYSFNTETKSTSFVNLLWNKVYSVKNYIPRTQKLNILESLHLSSPAKNRRFSGLKSLNFHESNNPIPYNNMWVNLNLRFMLICIITTFFIKLVSFLNDFIHAVNVALGFIGFNPFAFVTIGSNIAGDECEYLNGFDTFAPCHKSWGSKKEGNWEVIKKVQGDIELNKLFDCIETSLSVENEVVNFDFTNDWLNGSLYAPRILTKIKTNRKTGKQSSIYCGSIAGSYTNLHLIQTCTTPIDGFGTGSTIGDNSECNSGSCYKQNSIFKISKGSLNRDLINDIYYYQSVEFPDQTPGNKYLFATDVILLGSLNDCDIDGIPQLHQLLPTTSFKLPPDSVESEDSGNLITYTTGTTGFTKDVSDYVSVSNFITPPFTGDVNNLFHVISTSGDTYYIWSGSAYTQVFDLTPYIDPIPITGTTLDITGRTIEVSGVDWGNKDVNSHLYNFKNGLYVAIGCTSSDTYTKTCINASRLCEIGVDFDERYDFNLISTEVDGYISTDEITDGDVRSMFATLNGNSLKTKKVNNQLKYDFRYIYPDSFDGKLKPNNGTGPLSGDTFSQHYYNYRFNVETGELGYDYSDDHYSFPRYDNSFYFYFGLKQGSTALDVFNNQYFVPCDGPENINT